MYVFELNELNILNYTWENQTSEITKSEMNTEIKNTNFTDKVTIN